jgi:GAF domain-containing protein
MKASQAVAGEIVLEKLIETLMMIAVEHAGAERGLLILSHGEELRIAAEARTGRDGVEVELQHALVTPSDLPDSLLHYVIRTQESVILDDASTRNLFSEDEYVRQRCPRSVLSLALVKQAKLIGVLYLENSLVPPRVHAQTPGHVGDAGLAGNDLAGKCRPVRRSAAGEHGTQASRGRTAAQ